MDRRAGVLLFNYQGTTTRTPTWYNEEVNEGQRGIMNNQLEYGREGTLCNNQLERREKSYVGRGTRDINEDNEEQKINYL